MSPRIVRCACVDIISSQYITLIDQSIHRQMQTSYQNAYIPHHIDYYTNKTKLQFQLTVEIRPSCFHYRTNDTYLDPIAYTVIFITTFTIPTTRLVVTRISHRYNNMTQYSCLKISKSMTVNKYQQVVAFDAF